MRDQKLSVGDHVAYSAAFCRSIGELTGDIPFARGIVRSVEYLGKRQFATIDWDGDFPPKVFSGNLSRVTSKGILDV